MFRKPKANSCAVWFKIMFLLLDRNMVHVSCFLNLSIYCLFVVQENNYLLLFVFQVGRLDPEHGRVGGHTQDVLDIAWNPFDDNMIASSSEDASVKIWQIPDEGLGKEILSEPLLTLSDCHQRKVHQVLWHPVASNILLSASTDPLIVIWNLETGEAAIEIDCHPDIIYSISWNTNGSLIATTCKDKKIRTIDVRKGEVITVSRTSVLLTLSYS